MKDEDVKNIEAIDNLLRGKFDLGFLLDVVEKHKGANEKSFIYWLPIVDILRFIPDFENEVKRIREKYHISPSKLNEELQNLLGKEKYLLYIHRSKEFARGLDLLNLDKLEEWTEIEVKIEAWVTKNFPTISKEVGKLRLDTLKKLPLVWHKAINDYILFNKTSISPVLFKKPIPKISNQVEPETLEPYIEVRVYANTDLTVFKKIGWLTKMQKSLPDYFNQEKFDEKVLLRRFFYFVIT